MKITEISNVNLDRLKADVIAVPNIDLFDIQFVFNTFNGQYTAIIIDKT